MISDAVEEVAIVVLNTSKASENAKLVAVKKKYEDKKLSRISKLAELTGPAMEKLAQGDFC